MKNLNKYFYSFFLLLFLPGYVIVYGQLNANFSASSIAGCTPLNVQFKDLSTGNPTQWIWDFGNGTTSTLQNPTATYINKGNYTVRLIIKNASGENYIQKQNYIIVSQTPDVAFTLDKSSGCYPLNVNFQNNTNLFGSGIKSWLWNFGDGSTSNQQNTLHNYNSKGVYNVTLSAVNSEGCNDTISIIHAVKTGNLPTGISFKASPLDGCASALRKFTSAATGNVNSWSWDFGDGGTSSLTNPLYHYTDTGWFSVKLKAGDNGCEDSVTHNMLIHVIGPVAIIHRKIDCSAPYSVMFNAPATGAQNWLWDFGDGTTAALKQVTHTYQATGIFNVKLTVSSASCFDTTNTTIYIVQQKPSYTAMPLQKKYCRNDSIKFVITNFDSLLTRSYAWSFDNGFTRTPYRSISTSFTNVFTETGIYPTPILYIYNQEGCFDTIRNPAVTINIKGASAGFKSSSPGCVDNNIIFSDQSMLVDNSPIQQWKWNFGDGDSLLTNNSPANHKFPFPGLYNVLLKITDADGCSDTISNEINISDKPIINAGSDTFICAGKSITLKPTGGTSYIWNNNVYLSCTNCANPIATPLDATLFFVTGKNAAGCPAHDSIKVNVQQRETLTVQPITDTICAGNSVQLSASGYNTYKWQPEEGLNNTSIPNPVATPSGNTVYTVTATDKSGCFTSTGSVNLIASKKPTLNIKDSEVTVLPGTAYHINTNYSSNITKWEWQPAEWLSDATIANPVATPQQNITYTVYATTAAGCVSVNHITINVTCNNASVFMPNTFSPNGDGINDYFFPRSNGNINFKSLKIFNRWGQEVFKKDDFSSNNQSAGWDGKYNGILQQADVYTYLLQSACSNGRIFNSYGSVTLIR